MFRNRSIKKIALIYLALAIAGAVYLYFTVCAVALLPWAIVLLVSFYVVCSHVNVTQKEISNMSLALDKILHGDYSVNFGEYSEGELSILKGEIDKTVIRLRHHNIIRAII